MRRVPVASLARAVGDPLRAAGVVTGIAHAILDRGPVIADNTRSVTQELGDRAARIVHRGEAMIDRFDGRSCP